MRVLINPAPLSGIVSAIPSKSDAHRKLICAAISDGVTKIKLPKTSADIEVTISCLEALGAHIERDKELLIVTPVDKPSENPLLDCGESGSTLRFLLPVAAAVCGSASFTGSGRLPERPLDSLIETMKNHGVSFTSDRLPFTIKGKLEPGMYTLPGNVSSQYITGLLLALPTLDGSSTIKLTTALESSAYVDITLDVINKFGIQIKLTKNGYFIKGGQIYYTPSVIDTDGDWSNAACFLAAGAFAGEISVTGLDTKSPQGDLTVTGILERFGARVNIDEKKVTVCPSALHGCDIDISGVPDLLPVLAVVAAHAKGETRFSGGARLRLKESDRLKSTAAMINTLGGNAAEQPDGLIVYGKTLTGGVVDSFNDHRIVMAAAIAAAECSGTVIINCAEAVNKSYPSFFDDYISLGGEIDVI